MDITILKKSLEHYLTTTTDETEINNITKTLSEINEQISIYSSPELWKHSSYIITPDSLASLLISKTYDEYGRFRKTNGSVTLDQYRNIVYNICYLTELTDYCISFGFDIITDLWSDNEHYGNNNPDGTFKL